MKSIILKLMDEAIENCKIGRFTLEHTKYGRTIKEDGKPILILNDDIKTYKIYIRNNYSLRNFINRKLDKMYYQNVTNV